MSCSHDQSLRVKKVQRLRFVEEKAVETNEVSVVSVCCGYVRLEL